MRVISNICPETNTCTYTAWEQADTEQAPQHLFLIATHDSQVWGRIGSNTVLPPELDALPPLTEERFSKVAQWHETLFERAYQAIVTAHPNAAGGERNRGEIVLSLAA